MKNNLSAFYLGVICFGTIIGAGFASGKEIWIYFARFGWYAYPILVITGIIFAIMVNMIFKFGYNNQLSNFSQLNKSVFKNRIHFGEWLFCISNFIVLAGMFAGINAISEMNFQLESLIFVVIFVIFSFLISLLKFRNLMKINGLVVPILLILIILAMFISPISSTTVTYSKPTYAPIFAIIYLSSNLYLISFILTKLGCTSSPKIHTKASIIFAILFIVFSFIISITLQSNPQFCFSNMPIVAILSSCSTIYKVLSSAVIMLSILTTVINIIYSLSNIFTKFIHSKITSNFIICAIGFILSNLGFNFIVNYFYFVIGIIGIIYLFFIIKNSP